MIVDGLQNLRFVLCMMCVIGFCCSKTKQIDTQMLFFKVLYDTFQMDTSDRPDVKILPRFLCGQDL